MTTTIAAHELEALIDTELETYHEEISSPSKAITFVADALPALGIVAAVLGIVLTMGKMKEPPEVLGAEHRCGHGRNISRRVAELWICRPDWEKS